MPKPNALSPIYDLRKLEEKENKIIFPEDILKKLPPREQDKYRAQMVEDRLEIAQENNWSNFFKRITLWAAQNDFIVNINSKKMLSININGILCYFAENSNDEKERYDLSVRLLNWERFKDSSSFSILQMEILAIDNQIINTLNKNNKEKNEPATFSCFYLALKELGKNYKCDVYAIDNDTIFLSWFIEINSQISDFKEIYFHREPVMIQEKTLEYETHYQWQSLALDFSKINLHNIFSQNKKIKKTSVNDENELQNFEGIFCGKTSHKEILSNIKVLLKDSWGLKEK